MGEGVTSLAAAASEASTTRRRQGKSAMWHRARRSMFVLLFRNTLFFRYIFQLRDLLFSFFHAKEILFSDFLFFHSKISVLRNHNTKVKHQMKRKREGLRAEEDEQGGEVELAAPDKVRPRKEGCNSGGGHMDHLPVELVSLVLCHVDRLSLPVCRDVCRKWSDALTAQCLPNGAGAGCADDGKGTTTTLAQAAAEVVAEEEDGEENYWNYAGRLAAHGRLTVLQWARAQGCPVEDEIEHARGHAARTGHLPVLQWLYDVVENNEDDDDDESDGDGDDDNVATAEQAAKGGQVAVLEWLRDRRGCAFADARLCELAAEQGQQAAVQWLRANGCEWDERACYAAAHGGHLALLQWLRSEGCPWDRRTCSNAAHGGHLEVLQWARANGCPWDESTCTDAAFGGRLDVLQWARANGCPWDSHTIHAAEEEGHDEVAQWLRASGCPE
jgi:hypothetical protein